MNSEVVVGRLQRIWSDVLGVDEVAGDASFFELGGHSLLAIRVMARVEEQFGVDLPLTALFQHPNLNDFAKIVEAEAGQAEPIAPAPVDVVPPAPAAPSLGSLLGRLDELSDDEAARLLTLIETDRGIGTT